MVAVEIPPNYGWVVLGAGICPVIVHFYLSGVVMAARAKYGIGYPNLYAVPGFHKNADEFNRVQRGHQNYLEGLVGYEVTALLGGLQYPLATAIGAVCFCVGSILYQKGYSDNALDVKDARLKKGGPIKYIGVIISLYSTCSLGYSLLTSA